jgi:SAM-dependent methyltransferase
MIDDALYSKCGVCESAFEDEILMAQERMLGYCEKFPYARCKNCGCLQSINPPEDLSKYYPQNYYAFEPGAESLKRDPFPFRRRFLYFPITAARLGWPTAVGRFLRRIGSGPFIPNSMSMLARPLHARSPILDVGCGNGRELFSYRLCGFNNLRGIDPYLQKELNQGPEFQLQKKELSQVEGKFHLIMFHHVYEHLQDPLGTLELAKSLLNPGGQILIRIPLSDSETARKYGEKWVQLDAPRHFFLHTRKSMKFLADKSGMSIEKVVYDSEGFQFLGSELYQRSEMSLNEFYSDYARNYSKIFKPGEDAAFQKYAFELNARNAGDQAGFCLVKVNE